jgi:hypothetical protein
MWMALTSSLFSSDLRFHVSQRRHIGEAQEDRTTLEPFFPVYFPLERATQQLGMVHVAQ